MRTATGTEMAPEKSHRNRRSIKNPNLFRYLCTEGICLCIARSPRKASPFDGYPSYDNRMSPPKILTCAKKWHSKNEISSSPGGLFDEFRQSQVPKSLTFDHFFSKYVSRKTSPVSQVGACDPCPEKAHLKAYGAGKPGFPSRKVSPLGHHRPRRALLLCKMASTSRKSSRQIPVESRGTSPFAKSAQKMGRIGARSRSCKFSPMSAQAENCEVRHSAASTVVWPRKPSPLGKRVFYCDPESAHDPSCNGSRSSLNPITSAPAEDHLGSRKTSPCRPESLAP